MRIFLVLSLLFLCSCATPEQRAAYAINKYGPTCERLGYSGQQEKQCIVALYKANQRNTSSGILDGLSSALRGAGETLSPQVYANDRGLPYIPPQQPVTTRCHPDYMGGFTCTQQ
jgi:hypothetical protein